MTYPSSAFSCHTKSTCLVGAAEPCIPESALLLDPRESAAAVGLPIDAQLRGMN